MTGRLLADIALWPHKDPNESLACDYCLKEDIKLTLLGFKSITQDA